MELRLLGLTTMLALMGGCSSPTSVSPYGPETLIELHIGEERQLEGTDYRLSFGRVTEDSRCPTAVVCTWAGNAAVEIGIAAGTGPTHPLVLNTSLEPRQADWHAVRVTLLEVAPAPREPEPIPLDTYSVWLRVEPLQP